jgi:hypothetical protein
MKTEDPVGTIELHTDSRVIKLTQTAGNQHTLPNALKQGEKIVNVTTPESEYERVSVDVKWTEPRTIVLGKGYLVIAERTED